MSSIDDALIEVNQELEDMAAAESAAKEKGLSLGDYNLQTAAKAHSQDRIEAERIEAERIGQIQLQAAESPTGTDPRSATAENTYSRFKVGGIDYRVIEDNEKARKMIQYDADGNIDPNSPVKVVGKNIGGGFVLAAQKDVKGVSDMKIPITQGQGINFPGLESDVAGDPGRMGTIHMSEQSDPDQVFDSNAARQIYDIYQRTGEN